MSEFKPTFKETVKRPLGELKWDPNVDISGIEAEDVTEQEPGKSYQFIGGVGPGEGGDLPKDKAPADGGGDAGEVAKFSDQPVGKDADFEESHPRDEIGRFAHGAGESSGPGGKVKPLKTQFSDALQQFRRAYLESVNGDHNKQYHGSSAVNELRYAYPNTAQLKSFNAKYKAVADEFPQLAEKLQPLVDTLNSIGAKIAEAKNPTQQAGEPVQMPLKDAKRGFDKSLDKLRDTLLDVGKDSQQGGLSDKYRASDAFNNLYYATPNASQMAGLNRKYEAFAEAYPELAGQVKPVVEEINQFAAAVQAGKDRLDGPKQQRPVEQIQDDLSRVRQSRFMTMGERARERGLVRELNAALRAKKEQEDAKRPVGARHENISQHVDTAIAPIRDQMRAAYDTKLQEQYQTVKARLEANGMDFNKAFPRPSSSGMSRAQYVTARRTREAAEQWVSPDPDKPRPYRFEDPNYVKPKHTDEQRRAVIDQKAKELAQMAYKDYVGKLSGKIKDAANGVPVADVSHRMGQDLWDWSVLDAKLENGETLHFQTKQILNISVLGTPYNQWPTRLIGAKKTT